MIPMVLHLAYFSSICDPQPANLLRLLADSESDYVSERACARRSVFQQTGVREQLSASN